jgi:cation:H+ antiporter
MRVPPLLVGLTLVAWGTSFPELAFNLSSAIDRKPDLVFGNVVGANICNLGLVLGVASLIAPLAVHSSIVRREIPLTLMMAALMIVATQVPSLERGLAGRLEPLILLAAFAAYSCYVIRAGWRNRYSREPLATQTLQSEIARTQRPFWLIGMMGAAGILLLGVGGNLASDAASALARLLGMSERVLGVTIVAFCTTLPELITAILAARQGQFDLAVGNALGSCLFNIGAIFSLCHLITPAPTPPRAGASLLCMLVLAALLVPFAFTFGRKIARIEGLALLAVQGVFVAYELSRTPSQNG